MLGDLVPADDLADAQADLVLAGKPALVAPGCLADLVEVALGGPQQGLALACPLHGEQRVAAGDQTLAGEVGMMDLGQVALVEERGLQRPAGGQLADRRCPQGGDPLQPGRPHLLADARLGEHAAIAHQHHPREPEAPAHLVDLRAQCGGIGGVALEHLDRHRAALRVAQKPEHDLQLAALAVAGVAVTRQRTAASFQPGRGDVVEHQGAVLEVTLGQRPFDPALALQQPVHGLVELVFVDIAQGERLAETTAKRVLAEPARGGELRARRHDAGDDHRHCEIAQARAPGGDQPIQPEAAQDPEHRCDMAEGTRTGDVEAVLLSARLAAGHCGSAAQQDAQAVDQVRRATWRGWRGCAF